MISGGYRFKTPIIRWQPQGNAYISLYAFIDIDQSTAANKSSFRLYYKIYWMVIIMTSIPSQDIEAHNTEIINKLSIQSPDSCTPIHFSNAIPMDYHIVEILRENLMEQEIKVGLPPKARDMEQQFKILKDQLYEDDLEKAAVKFAEEWDIIDPEDSEPSVWRYVESNTVKQLSNAGSRTEEATDGLGSIAISQERVNKAAISITMEMTMGSANEAGLVFNFQDAQNYWIFKYGHILQTAEHYVAVLRMQDSNITTVSKAALDSELINTDIRYMVSVDNAGTEPQLVLQIWDQAGTLVETFTIAEPSLIEGSGVGLFTRFCQDAHFKELSIEYADSLEVLLPVDGEPRWLISTLEEQQEDVLEGEEEYEDKFSYDVIDMRPIHWLKSIRRLWAECLFAKKRFERVEEIYNKAFENDITPGEIDRVEDMLRRAFEHRLESEQRFEDFKTFLKGEGVEIITQFEDDADLFGNYTVTFRHKIQKRVLNIWKEFHVIYQVCPDWEDHCRIYNNRVRHKTFYTTDKGLYRISIIYGKGRVYSYVKGKYWHTKHKEEVHDQEIEITHAGNIFAALEELVEAQTQPIADTEAGKIIEKEYDIRRYNFVNNEYLDQYGETMHDHVIEISEQPDDSKEHILVVPMMDDPEQVEPSKYIIVRNPVFSGKQVSPFNVWFDERFTMGVKWDGIGLGEFSHSVNLFPGEDRDIQVVTTKKRSFESSSRINKIAKLASTSEASTETKRNDSFESKLQSSLEQDSGFETSSTSSSTSSKQFGANGSVNVGFGNLGASIGVNYQTNATSKSESTSKSSLSAVMKQVSDIASRSSSEVSQNNKVSFMTSTETETNLEEKVKTEDTETQTEHVVISNINEGKTINYNFYQITNVYGIDLHVADVKINISTGIEIIPGTGLTISKTYDIEDFDKVLKDFRVYSIKDREEIVKALAAEILMRYYLVEEDGELEEIGDNPRILRSRNNELSAYQLRILRNKCEKIRFEKNKSIVTGGTDVESRQHFHGELLEFSQSPFYVRAIQAGDTEYYTVNSGKYYVDSQVGQKPATESYLEKRRDIETEKQQALVEDIKARIESGVFYPEASESWLGYALLDTLLKRLKEQNSDLGNE